MAQAKTPDPKLSILTAALEGDRAEVREGGDREAKDPLTVENASTAMLVDGLASNLIEETESPWDGIEKVRVRRVIEYEGPIEWVRKQLTNSKSVGKHTDSLPAGASMTIYQGEPVSLDEDAP
jgi:hypothetical protein